MITIPYSQRGGIVTDTYFLSWPFAKILVTYEALHISSFVESIIIKHQDIEVISIVGILYNPGINIIHKKIQRQKAIAFYPAYPIAMRPLLQALKLSSYTVKKNNLSL